MPLKSINPATGQDLKEYELHTADQVERLLSGATEAFRTWRNTPFAARAEHMVRAAAILRDRQDHWGEIMAREMGKPITQGRAEAQKCAWVCEYYAEHAVEFLQNDLVGTDADLSYVRYEPLGPILAVMPWNYPFWQVFRFAAPGLMAGNVGLLSHAPNVPECALAIEEIFTDAGFPAGVFQTLFVDIEATHALIRDPRVKAVTMTGSVRAGKSVAEAAGREIKKTVLELGGSDPFIILAEADINRAAEVGAGARCLNSGQSCIAAKRFIVVENHLQQFTERLVELMGNRQVGDPMEADVRIGPQARQDLLENLHRQVTESVEQGAELLLGGAPLERAGYFYPPTVLANVQKGMPAYHEEIFGPVAAIIPAKDDAEAIRLANDTDYGLGASLWCADLEKAERHTGELEAGSVFVNGLVKSDPRLPFGGVKQSGYGRELGVHGIREFVNVKTVWIGK